MSSSSSNDHEGYLNAADLYQELKNVQKACDQLFSISLSSSSGSESQWSLADLYRELSNVEMAYTKLFSLSSFSLSGLGGHADLADLHKQLKDMENTFNDKIPGSSTRSSSMGNQLHVGSCIDISKSSISLALCGSTTLDTFRGKLDSFETSLRQKINVLLPPHLRLCNILHLPTELLAEMLSNLANDGDGDSSSVYRRENPQQPTSDIQNLRLTCRKLNNASSRFLINTIYISLKPASISRLKEISQHPNICQSVITIKFSLALYDRSLARDFSAFVVHYETAIAQAVAEMEGGMHKTFQDDWNEGKRGFPRNIGHTRSTFEDYSQPKNLRLESLKRAHSKYVLFYLEQERMCKNGVFLRDIAAALARMPLARDLCICQQAFNRSERGLPLRSSNDLEMVLENVIRTKAVERNPLGPLEDIQTKLLFALPGEIRKAGGSPLLRLGIDVAYLWPVSNIDLSEADLNNLTQAMAGVKNLSVRIGGRPCNPPKETEGLAKLATVFSSLLNTTSLKNVSFDLPFLATPIVRSSFPFHHPGFVPWQSNIGPSLPALNEQDFRMSFYGKLVGSKAWATVIDLSLIHVPIHLDDLRTILNHSVGTLKELDINHVKLLSGTWAEVLDLLYSQDADVAISVGDKMSGAELSGFVGRIPFASHLDSERSRSSAQLYVDWEIELNPFRSDSKDVAREVKKSEQVDLYNEEVKGEDETQPLKGKRVCRRPHRIDFAAIDTEEMRRMLASYMY